MGGDTSSNSSSSDGVSDGSLFRVGESISLAHVLLFLSLLVLFVVLLEQLLHKLEHSAKKSHKHEEMLRKVYRELMILGFIGIAIKVYKEVTHVSAYSDSIIAFQVADLTIFMLAVALILQAMCVFLALRHENFELEKAELLSPTDLISTVAQRRRDQETRPIGPIWWQQQPEQRKNQPLNELSDREVNDLIELRVLRHLFLRRYGLPELFPFSKYVRQAQDNQITHMIDVQISMWLLLLSVAWAIDGGILLLKQVHGYAAESHAIVVMFFVFAWSLVGLHALVAAYFRGCLGKLLCAGGYAQRDDAIACLAAIGEDEDAALCKEMASDALEEMQQVQERQEAKHRRAKMQRRSHHRHQIVERDTGFQLLALALRHLIQWIKSFGTSEPSACDASRGSGSRVDSAATLTSTISATPPASFDLGTYDAVRRPTVERRSRRRSAELSVQIRWFSRKAWQFGVMVLLMLNGFYLALLCQCVFYQFGLLGSYSLVMRVVIVVGLPLPMVLNMAFFQPQILRNFMIISSIVQVDVSTLSKVVTHFSEIVELRTEFVRSLLASLSCHGVTVDQLQRALEAKDRHERSGEIELEQLRLVLRSVGFRLSHFRFHSVARLLFQLRDTKVEYAQVLRMICLAQVTDEATNSDGAEALVHETTTSASKIDSRGHSSHLLLRQSVFVEDEVEIRALEDRAWRPHPHGYLHQEDHDVDPARVGLDEDSHLAFGSVFAAAGGLVETEATCNIQRHRMLTRRQSSFQNTSVRTLRSLYRLDAADLSNDTSVGDHSPSERELSSPSNASVYTHV